MLFLRRRRVNKDQDTYPAFVSTQDFPCRVLIVLRNFRLKNLNIFKIIITIKKKIQKDKQVFIFIAPLSTLPSMRVWEYPGRVPGIGYVLEIQHDKIETEEFSLTLAWYYCLTDLFAQTATKFGSSFEVP